MSDEDKYVPRQGDMVIFDRPPLEGGQHSVLQHRVFQVASHDAQTGMTTFARLPRALSAHEMTELGPESYKSFRRASWSPTGQARDAGWPGKAQDVGPRSISSPV
jgi:hypothetical protein